MKRSSASYERRDFSFSIHLQLAWNMRRKRMTKEASKWHQIYLVFLHCIQRLVSCNPQVMSRITLYDGNAICGSHHNMWGNLHTANLSSTIFYIVRMVKYIQSHATMMRMLKERFTRSLMYAWLHCVNRYWCMKLNIKCALIWCLKLY